MNNIRTTLRRLALAFGLILAMCGTLLAASCGKASYRIVFMSEGSEYTVAMVEEGENLIFPAGPEKKADAQNTYEFCGWSATDLGVLAEDEAAGELYAAAAELPVTEAATFYAVFRAHPIIYTVIFRDGVTNARIGDEQKVPAGEDAVPPEPPVHEGYTFKEWSGSYRNIKGRTEITAVYEANEYDLVLHELGEVRTVSVKFGSLLSAVRPGETPEAVTFEGWYYDEAHTGAERVGEADTMPAHELHLYANFEIKEGHYTLSLTGDGVYGDGDDVVHVMGLPQEEDGATYTFTWANATALDGGKTALVKAAGVHEVVCVIREAVEGAEPKETTVRLSVTLKKATLTAQVHADGNVVYGTDPAPSAEFAGFKYEDTDAGLETSFSYLKEGAPAEGRLHVGEYSVTVALGETENYVLGEVTQAQLSVAPKQLTVTAHADNVEYGAQPAPTLSYEGFLSGDGESLLSSAGEKFVYQKGGKAHTGKFTAGEYTVRAGNFTAADYTVVQGEACTFEVTKRAVTLTVTAKQASYIYGETPAWDVTKTLGELVEGDVLGTAITYTVTPSYTGRPAVGQHTLALSAEAENYAVTTVGGSFEVTRRTVTATLTAEKASYTFGDAVTVNVQWANFADGESETTLFGKTPAVTYKKGGEAYAKAYFSVGAYEAGLDVAAGENGNYTVQIIPANFSVTQKEFTVGKTVTQSHEDEFSFAPAFPEDETRYVFTGTVVLQNSHVGKYDATDEESFGASFSWKEGNYSIHLKDGDEDVTENFKLVYDLHVTLNASTFTVSEPDASARSVVYDGHAHTFGVTVTHKSEEQVEVKTEYRIDGSGDYTQEVPSFTEVGSHTVEYRVTAQDFDTVESSYTVEITKATSNAVSVNGEQTGFVYGTAGDSGKTYTFTVSATFGEVTASGTFNGAQLTVTKGEGTFSFTAKDAGTYSVTFSVADTANYNGATSEVSVTVEKADYAYSVTSSQTYTYNTEKQGEGVTLTTSPAGAKVTYAVGDASQYEETVPTFTDADTYTVKFKITGNVNYNDEAGSYTVTIDKADYEAITPHDAVSATMKFGGTLADVKLTENYRWKEEGTELQVGSHAYEAVYNADARNYNDFELQITVNAQKKKVKATVAESFEADFGSASDDLFVATYSADDGSLEENESSYLTTAVSRTLAGTKDYNVGSAYLVTVDLTLDDDNYYELTGTTSFEVILKVKSVSVNDVLYTIEDALKVAENTTVTVKNNTSFAAKDVAARAGYTAEGGYYTIKAGVTLKLPYNGTDTYGSPGKDSTATNTLSFGDLSQQKLLLTLPDEIVLNNAGKIEVGGYVTGSGGSCMAGQTFGAYARIDLGANAKIESNGDIDVYGFITETSKNNQSEVVMHSGTMKMPFVVVEHRGGSNFVGIGQENPIQGAPFNRFFLHNISAQLILEANASLYGCAKLKTDKKSILPAQENATEILLIGKDSKALISLGENSKVVAKLQANAFDQANAKSPIKLDVYGDMTLNAMSLHVSVAGILNTDITTKGVLFPISWYWQISLNPLADGVPATVNATEQDIKLLPGGSLTVAKDVTLNAGKIAVYKEGSWSDAGVGASKYESGKGDGLLTVNGALHVNEFGGEIQNSAVVGATVTIQTAAQIDSKELKDKIDGSFGNTPIWETISLSLGFISGTSNGTGTYNWNGTAWQQQV